MEMTPLTEFTITDPHVSRELRLIPRRKTAYSREKRMKGPLAMAAPIMKKEENIDDQH
jgi:DNA-binding IclR family transcriptional regulator